MQNLAENLTRYSGSSILLESKRLVIEMFIYDREIWGLAAAGRRTSHSPTSSGAMSDSRSRWRPRRRRCCAEPCMWIWAIRRQRHVGSRAARGLNGFQLEDKAMTKSVTMTNGMTKSAEVRSQLKHPVVDADGHWLEVNPVFWRYIDQVAGPGMVERYKKVYGSGYAWHSLSPEERQRQRIRRPGWWGLPVKSEDRAAAMIPRMFREKLDDWGIDVALVYPTLGFTLTREIPDDELLQATVRAYNVMVADMFSSVSDRAIPAGVVSLNRPDEAIAQIEHAHSLGIKMLSVNGIVPRTVEADADWQPDPKKRRVYIDGLGMDSH